MKKKPLLSSLASQQNPLEDLATVVAVLKGEKKESRFLEWKLDAPTGPGVTTRTKYRTVKAAVSFANADGGFIVFGVEPSGRWAGLQAEALALVDPAHILELVNGCLFPDIQILNFAEFKSGDLTLAVVHVPPSAVAPHVTTKEVFEKDGDVGKPRQVIAKNAVYYRQGAKSDLATAIQHQRIVNKRVERLSDELVRRVKEVTIPIPGANFFATSGQQSITVTRLSKNPNAPAVRLTRSREGTSGVFLHEELSDGLFEEINNVIDANLLLNKGRDKRRFMLGEAIYYRIYAERHHVEDRPERISMLFRTGFLESYYPYMYWALKSPVQELAEYIKVAAASQVVPQVNALVRLVTLLGPKVSDWLWGPWEMQWRNRQAPDHYWALKEIRQKKDGDRRFTALRVTGKATLAVPGGSEITYEKLLRDGADLPNQVTKACVEVFGGSKDARTPSRTLDLLAYGLDLQAKASLVEKELGLS